MSIVLRRKRICSLRRGTRVIRDLAGMNPDLAFARGGHENHMRAINAIRESGGIAPAVKKKILIRGIMHACVLPKSILC